MHELRGFVSDHLLGAFDEVRAICRGTKAKQYLFSLSLNPPPNEQASTQAFENAIEAAEKRLGLSNQPRAIVFHEKNTTSTKTERSISKLLKVGRIVLSRYAHENDANGIGKGNGGLQVRLWFHALMKHINDFNALIGKAIVKGMRANKGAVITRFHVGALSA